MQLHVCCVAESITAIIALFSWATHFLAVSMTEPQSGTPGCCCTLQCPSLSFRDSQENPCTTGSMFSSYSVACECWPGRWSVPENGLGTV